MLNESLNIVTKCIMSANKKGFFRKLMDKNDPEIAASNFFVICVLAIGLVLLAVPIFALIIEAWFNHTISTDLNGMAAYIMAVAAIFTSAGITKIGVHYTDNKYLESRMKEREFERREDSCDDGEPNEEIISD